MPLPPNRSDPDIFLLRLVLHTNYYSSTTIWAILIAKAVTSCFCRIVTASDLTGWADIAVGAIIAVIFIRSAWRVLSSGGTAWRDAHPGRP